MLKNFFKTAFRQFIKNRWYSIIHVIGLTLGLGTSLVLLMLVKHEWSFDRQWDDSNRIFRISSNFSGVFEATNPGITAPAGKAVRADFPEFSDVAPIYTMSGPAALSSSPDESFQENKFAFVDTAFFHVFPNWVWLHGQQATALNTPGQILLSDKTAEKYFGEVGPSVIGKEIVFRDSVSLVVAGIFEEQSRNTDLYFEGYISFPTIESTWLKENAQLDNWSSTNSSSQLYVKTAPGVAADVAQVSLTRLEERQKVENPEADWNTNFVMVPLQDIHFDQKFGIFDGSPRPMRKSTLIALAIISLFLLALACFNFINLETAKAALRSREIGVRKVLGSSRRSLILQFLGETAILALLAAALTSPFIELLSSQFGDYLPAEFELNWLSWSTVLLLLSLVAVVTICSGLYPAWVITRVRVADSVRASKLSAKSGQGGGMIRKGLIAGQFFVTQLLLIGALVVWKQTDFAISKDMGFSKEAIVNFYMPWHGSDQQKDLFQNRVEQLGGVEQTTRFMNPPAFNGYSTTVLKYEQDGERHDINIHSKRGDSTYLNLFEIELIAGRQYLERDSIKEYVINETLARTMGFDHPADAVGSNLYGSQDDVFPIVGVTKDFHVQAVHKALAHVAMSFQKGGTLGVKIAASRWQDISNIIDQLEPTWKEIWPRNEFRYDFMDETIAKLYRSEVRTAKLLAGGTTIALIISCMGLLGLAAFLAHQRTKEIGIRKVLGASVGNIVKLLSWDFLKWILIAIVPASAVGYFVMREWLNDFAYRFDFSGLLILLAALCSILIAATAVMVQGYRAAQADPVDSLKLE